MTQSIIPKFSQIKDLSCLKSELKSLKIAYDELAIDHKISQTVIKVADKMFGTNLKKARR